jgi:pimeloyl-ACP methyl ester carboxylesterase
MRSTILPEIPKTRRRRLSIAALGGLIALLAGITVPAAQAAPTGSNCHDVKIPVTIAPLVSGPIAGTLCSPAGETADTLQILVHGYSYNRKYWDAGYQPETYSYPGAANARGYATLAIDRLGSGESFHPLSALVTYETGASAVQQVVTAAKRGDLGSPYQKIVLVGHSYGSLIDYAVAGQDKDVNALVVTGSAHQINIPYVATQLAPYLLPAALDRKFSNAGLDPGYLALEPGAPNRIFLNQSNTDPAMAGLNETSLKDTGTATELATLFPRFVTNLTLFNESKKINIPTLTVNGQLDPFFCGGLAADCSSGDALAAYEKPFFGPQAIVKGYVVPGTSHNTTMERTAPQSYAAMLDFIDQYVGN